jgi:DNA-binding response OmpR family regulator
MVPKILLLEDDALLNETLQDFLEEEGFEIDAFLDPYSALDAIFDKTYALYLFDVNLPYETGFDLLKKLRESNDVTPTIFLTSLEGKEALQEGFALGADDYMKKPIDLDELHCRILALLRRQVRTRRIKIGEYLFDSLEKKVYHNSRSLELTQKAVALLFLLIEAKGTVVPNDLIRSRLWAASEQASDGALRVYITQLKKYFSHNIVNIRGVGYKWVEN